MLVEVAYSNGVQEQWLKTVEVGEHTTIRGAIEKSGILMDYPRLNLETLQVGIYGQHKTLCTALEDKDRIEIYRPLIADPKKIRLGRVKKD